ncbi:FadR/GntR family transcriptional regulator [Acuticoccus kandeliae]|uniref:FadR/GntR family transcriptional regulator n=1 Tax=Acuticoccus kandeliae TaxID=2073160 RepID=UPI000D3E082E|nr:FadR/GntR family transcriptional regulator [Acuticoccus kandeliae]
MLRAVISRRAPKTSHSHVVNGIGRAIVGRIYEVGATLPGDAELGERFQVSRTVLREAMKTLAAKGLVVPRARIGTRVTNPKEWNFLDADVLKWHLETGIDPQFMAHIYEMRLSFEPAAARLAARNADADDIETLLTLADRLAEPHTDESFALVDLDFHFAVLDATKNPLLYSAGNLIEAALTQILRNSSPAGERPFALAVAKAHRAIATAIEAHDEAAADAAMRAVINMGWERMPERTGRS